MTGKSLRSLRIQRPKYEGTYYTEISNGNRNGIFASNEHFYSRKHFDSNVFGVRSYFWRSKRNLRDFHIFAAFWSLIQHLASTEPHKRKYCWICERIFQIYLDNTCLEIGCKVVLSDIFEACKPSLLSHNQHSLVL